MEFEHRGPSRTYQSVGDLLLCHHRYTVLPTDGDGREAIAVGCLERVLDLIQPALWREDGDVMIVVGIPRGHGSESSPSASRRRKQSPATQGAKGEESGQEEQSTGGFCACGAPQPPLRHEGVLEHERPEKGQIPPGPFRALWPPVKERGSPACRLRDFVGDHAQQELVLCVCFCGTEGALASGPFA
jgi:hypothetical protein